MKKINKLTLLVISFFMVCLLSLFYIIEGIQVYNYDIVVGNHIGFNLDSDMIHFGTVPKGEISKRGIIIHNTGKKSIVRIKSFGKISDSVYVSDNKFILMPDKSRSVTLYIETDKSMSNKKYTGYIIFILTKF